MLDRERNLLTVDQQEDTHPVNLDDTYYEMIDTSSGKLVSDASDFMSRKRFYNQTEEQSDYTDPTPKRKRASGSTGLADLSALSLKDRIRVQAGPTIQFFDDCIQDCIFSYLSANEIVRAIGKSNIRYYSNIVPKVMKENSRMTLTIPKVEKINKEGKSIEDLLTWNREV